MAADLTALAASVAEMHPRDALGGLLAAWREVSHPLLAQCIEAASARIEVESLRARRVSDTAKNFTEAARGKRDEMLGPLLEVFPAGSIEAGRKQVALLAKWPRDPRLAARLLELFEDPPYRSRKALPFWQRAMVAVRATADPRSFERVTVLLERIEQCFARPMSGLMRDELFALHATLPTSSPALSSGDEAALRALLASLTGPAVDRSSVDELLEQVYTDPDNDELRLVLADALSAAGDPRGELIMLQHQKSGGKRLTREQSKRAKALLVAHTGEWLGDLSPVLLSSSIKFRLGLLDEATLKPKNDAYVRPLVGDPRWATVRALEVKTPSDYYDEAAAAARGSVEALVLHPSMRGLRRLTGDLHPTLVIELCTSETTRPIEAIEVKNSWAAHADAVHTALAEAPGLPHLRELIYRRYGANAIDDYHWLRESPLFARLERVELQCSVRSLRRWIEVQASGGPARIAVRDFHGYNRVESDRSGGGHSIVARFRWPGMFNHRDDAFTELAMALAATPPGSLDRVEIAVSRTSGPRDSQVLALRRGLEHAQPATVKLPSALREAVYSAR